MQQPVLEPRPRHLDAIGQHEAALEGACGDAAVQEDPLAQIVGLPAADHQCPVLHGDREVILGEARHRKGDAEGVGAVLFDVVRRVGVGAGLRRPLDKALQLVEAQQVGMRAKAQFRHQASP
ncbi:hypothetical protein SDC9_16919 [bioreactor metagenome]|uniref:Uncharacterized protein n=1 Tax=bioreactor metagenome TaxID=1076179 RepID=A0A644TVY0_9ZZZZ